MFLPQPNFIDRLTYFIIKHFTTKSYLQE